MGKHSEAHIEDPVIHPGQKVFGKQLMALDDN